MNRKRFSITPVEISRPQEIFHLNEEFIEYGYNTSSLLEMYVRLIEKEDLEVGVRSKKRKKESIPQGISSGDRKLIEDVKIISDKMPTDLFLTIFFGKDGYDSDIAFENSVAVPEFESMLEDEGKTLILGMNPYSMNARLLSEYKYDDYDFVVQDETIKKMYTYQFPTSRFCTMAEAEKNGPYDYVYISSIGMSLSVSKYIQVMDKALSICGSKGRIMALLPNAVYDGNREECFRILESSGAAIEKITILPEGLLKGSGIKKQSVFYIHRSAEKQEKIDMEVLSFDGENRTSLMQTAIKGIPYSEFFKDARTLRVQANSMAKNGRSDSDLAIEHRNGEQTLSFSREIRLSYTIGKNRGKKYARACYRSMTVYKMNKRGGRLSDWITEGLRGNSEKEILEKLYQLPLRENISRIIRSDINENAEDKKKLTLKTQWFMLRNQLKQYSAYDDAAAQELFSKEPGMLSDIIPAEADAYDYLDGIKDALDKSYTAVSKKYLKTLETVLDLSVKEKYSNVNPMKGIADSLSGRMTKKQREVRASFMKKSFERSEMDRAVGYLCSAGKHASGGSAKRYASEWDGLAVAFKYFSPLSKGEVCALTFGDIKENRYLARYGVNLYEMEIKRCADAKGRIISYAETESRTRYRTLFVLPELYYMYVKRLEFLEHKTGLTEQELMGFPIFMTKDTFSKIRKSGKAEFLKPSDLGLPLKQAFMAADVKDRIHMVPGAVEDIEMNDSVSEGDFFKTNFLYYARYCGMLTEGEKCYCAGVKPPDTFSQYYCDYRNDFIRLEMMLKMRRWSVRFDDIIGMRPESRQEPSEYRASPCTDGWNPGIGLKVKPDSETGRVKIRINSSFGAAGTINSIVRLERDDPYGTAGT